MNLHSTGKMDKNQIIKESENIKCYKVNKLGMGWIVTGQRTQGYVVYLCRTISENQPYMVSKSLNNIKDWVSGNRR